MPDRPDSASGSRASGYNNNPPVEGRDITPEGPFSPSFIGRAFRNLPENLGYLGRDIGDTASRIYHRYTDPAPPRRRRK